MATTRIAVDARGYSAVTRGIDLYITNLLQRWLNRRDVHVSLIRTRTGSAPLIDIEAPFVRVSFAKTLVQRIPYLSRPLDELGKCQDVVFLPNMAVYPRVGRVPLVVTVHDATSLLYPEFFTVRDRVWHWLVDLRALVRSAACVLANSYQTRDEVLSLGVAPERTKVIYHGIGDEFRPATDAQVRATRAKYGISDRPYFLFLGAVERRKNVAAVERGFLEARKRGLDATLVVAGPVWEADQLCAASADVRVLGWVDAEDKAPLYSGATAAVSLAKHEGFGMLPLEALACGTRSILSPLPVYQETIGGLATYVDADDRDAVAQAMVDAQQTPAPVDPAAIRELRERFSWDRCATETLDTIAEA